MNTEPTMIQKMTGFIAEGAVKYSFQLIGGIIVLVAAWILSRFVAKAVSRALHKKMVDITIERFLAQAARIVILALGVLIALSSFGVQIAPLIAGLSVAGVGAGLALQGPLSNYAAGATLIFTKPFKVGDIIEVSGFQGEVVDITLPRTELSGLDGSTIVIPNKHIVGEVIKNFLGNRILEINVRVSYEGDAQKALKIIHDIIKDEKRIDQNADIKQGIKEFADSSVNLQAFVAVPQRQFVDVKFAVNNMILEEFRRQGIVIPFPRRDVHLYQKP